MNLIEKRVAALKLLHNKGLGKADYQPPGLRLLWWLGINYPPPLMVEFAPNAIASGSYFGIFMGAFFYFGLFNNSIEGALIGGAIGGIVFGLTMAIYFRSVRRKHNLPLWRDFTPVE